MLKRRLILHIGAHKTGTTAIQLTLRENREALAARGWHVLLPPRPGGKPANWNFMFQLDSGSVFRLQPIPLNALLAQMEASGPRQILSSEEFFFLEADEIRRFARAIAGRFDEIHLVAYLRRQDRMALSQWFQAARTRQSAALFANPAGPLADLPEAGLAYLGYADRLRSWIDALSPGRVSLRAYDRAALAGGDVVRDFLGVIGLSPLTGLRPRPYANEALGCETTFLLHELRAAGMDQPDITRILRANILPKGTPQGLPARADAQAFLDRFRESNAALAALTDPPFRFSDDFSDYPETARLPRFAPTDRARLLSSIEALLAMPQPANATHD